MSEVAHHSVFERYAPFSGEVPVEFAVDYIGARTRHAFLPVPVHRPGPAVWTPLPSFNEEYFEWIDLLESVERAGAKYTMLELGAGYGRWAVRAALAARRRGIEDFRLGAAEADATHYRWLIAHLEDNGIPLHRCDLLEAAVSDRSGDTYFYVGMPDGAGDDRPCAWYGQAKAKEYELLEAKVTSFVGKVFNKRRNQGPVKFRSGWKAVKVHQVSILEILERYSSIDLIDMDVQGEELKIIEAGVSVMDEKVRRLHIGTHSPEIDAGIPPVLERHGWSCLRKFPCSAETDTPYGRIRFVDGVQSWVNPRLE